MPRPRLWCPLAESIEKALCRGKHLSVPHADTKDEQEVHSAPWGTQRNWLQNRTPDPCRSRRLFKRYTALRRGTGQKREEGPQYYQSCHGNWVFT